MAKQKNRLLPQLPQTEWQLLVCFLFVLDCSPVEARRQLNLIGRGIGWSGPWASAYICLARPAGSCGPCRL